MPTEPAQARTLYTSNYARNGQHPKAVAISRGVPPWYKGARCLALAPTRAMLDLPREQFHLRMAAILATLDPAEVLASLPDGAILLCWESPRVACHRRMVAEWFESKTGLVVPEFGFPREGYPAHAEMPAKVKKPRRK